jgi:hypothetical protein
MKNEEEKGKGKGRGKDKRKLLTIETEIANLPLLHLDHRLLDEQKLGDAQIGEICRSQQSNKNMLLEL